MILVLLILVTSCLLAFELGVIVGRKSVHDPVDGHAGGVYRCRRCGRLIPVGFGHRRVHGEDKPCKVVVPRPMRQTPADIDMEMYGRLT